MNLDAIIAELEYLEEGVLPRKALQEAIAHKEDITPILLTVLEDSTTTIQRLVDEPDYILPIYAFLLLAQFRETKAYQPTINFFSMPGDTLYDVFQDFITEDLGRVLASVCDGELGPIKQLIETPILKECIRGAGLSALTVLMVEGDVTREELLVYFEHLFSTTSQDGSYMLTLLTISALEISPNDAILEVVHSAFENNLIESFMISPNDIKYYQNLGVKGCLAELRGKRYHHFIQDTIALLERWYCFREKTATSPQKTIPSPPPTLAFSEVRKLTTSSNSLNQSIRVKKKTKSKKSPLKEVQGFASESKRKSSSKKKRSKK